MCRATVFIIHRSGINIAQLLNVGTWLGLSVGVIEFLKMDKELLVLVGNLIGIALLLSISFKLARPILGVPEDMDTEGANCLTIIIFFVLGGIILSILLATGLKPI